VHSYISNSKAKRRTITIFITIIVLFLLSNYYLYHHFFQNTTKTNFISNMISKKHHMILNLKDAKLKDAIFIGNSRTLYQISTQLMAEQGFNIYNFGVSGHITPDFPSMIKSALKYHPKRIIICLAAPYFHNKLSRPKNVDLTDIIAYLKSHQNFTYISNAIALYVKGWFLVDVYAENINIRIRTIYKRLSNLNNFLNINHIKDNFRNALFSDKKFSFDKKFVKCNIFRTAFPKNLQAIGMCTNGDGVLVGNLSETSNDESHLPTNHNTPLSASHLRLLNYLLDNIKQHGVQPIVVFTPMFHGHYSVEYRKKTAAAIRAPVIDLTNLPLDDSMWENQGHLNMKGRYYYTLAVAKELNKLTGSDHDKKHPHH